MKKQTKKKQNSLKPISYSDTNGKTKHAQFLRIKIIVTPELSGSNSSQSSALSQLNRILPQQAKLMLTVHQSNMVVRRVPSMDDVRSIMERLEWQGLIKAFKKWHTLLKLEKTRAKNIGIILNTFYK